MKHIQSSVLITGAGSGIGRAIALSLANKNPDIALILTGRNTQNLQETINLLPSVGKHRVLPLDITNAASVKELKGFLVDQQITLNSLVLNAGIGGENQYGENDRWDEIIATNLTGPYQLTQELLPLLKSDKNDFKNIVFVSSILARLGVPKYSAYCSSKAGVLGLMRSLSAELASEKILVNAICPGWVDTEMSTRGIQDIAKGCGASVEDITKAVLSGIPLGKMSEPKEIGELVNFLVSGFQTSITGQTFDINNGALMP
jgi:NAD(P)-dependent dehydrogenase (short-subunit alcohol dehydrogenase family)